MEIICTQYGARALLTGELDHHLSAQLRPLLDDFITARRPARLVLDFTGVSFMDSSAIGLVLGRYRLVEAQGGQLLLTGLSPQQKKVMCLAGVSRLAPIVDLKGEKNRDGKPDETDTAV